MPTAAVDGIELYYELHGPHGAQDLVFVNGLLTDTTSWAPHLRRFTDRYRCVVYDCRGQGRSSKLDEVYTTQDHADDLRALLDALGIGRALFVGLSNGGAALLHFAADHPDRVRGLALADVYAHADVLMQAKLGSWVAAMAAGGAPLRFDVATPWVWGARFLSEHHATLLAFRDKGSNIPVAAAVNLIRGAMQHDARDKLARISAPALVLVGEEDVLTPPWLARDLVARLPRARLQIIEGAGHAAALEQVDGFCAVVRDFFDDIEPR